MFSLAIRLWYRVGYKALIDGHKEEWLLAMQEEMQSLHENQTYELVGSPKGKRELKIKWVYKLNTEEDSS